MRVQIVSRTSASARERGPVDKQLVAGIEDRCHETGSRPASRRIPPNLNAFVEPQRAPGSKQKADGPCSCGGMDSRESVKHP